ncbi:hypothetical protein C8R43DRAFT_1052848 [Mycena crocata]|nr:hypothetical protein C8R43DRAFT_1052848 [Mycena crocata]
MLHPTFYSETKDTILTVFREVPGGGPNDCPTLNGPPVSKEDFVALRDFVARYGRLPCVSIGRAMVARMLASQAVMVVGERADFTWIDIQRLVDLFIDDDVVYGFLSSPGRLRPLPDASATDAATRATHVLVFFAMLAIQFGRDGRTLGRWLQWVFPPMEAAVRKMAEHKARKAVEMPPPSTSLMRKLAAYGYICILGISWLLTETRLAGTHSAACCRRPRPPARTQPPPSTSMQIRLRPRPTCRQPSRSWRTRRSSTVWRGRRLRR